jgi:PLP dependent protein
VAPGARAEGAALNVESVRTAYERVRAEAGPAVTVVAATKYVSLSDLAILAEAEIAVVGENRAQDLQAKHAAYGSAFRWHFIGHLQSNKAKVVNETCELVHSLSSDSAAGRLTVPALLEVNLSGESSKSGVSPEEVPGYLERYPTIRGLMTMPPLAADPEDSRSWFRRLRVLAEANGLRELSMGTSQDWRVAVEEGATLIRLGSVLYDDARRSSTHS